MTLQSLSSEKQLQTYHVYMQNKLYTANTIRSGSTKFTFSLTSLQLCYDKEHNISYKPVKVCMYNLR